MTGASKALTAVKAAAVVVIPGAAALGLVYFGKILFDFSKTTQGTLNFPPPKYWLRILRLRKITQLMAPIGRPNSAYRSEHTNELVGGVDTSAHKTALGEDFGPTEGNTMDDVHGRALELQDQGVFGYVLNEGDHIHTEVNPHWRPTSLI